MHAPLTRAIELKRQYIESNAPMPSRDLSPSMSTYNDLAQYQREVWRYYSNGELLPSGRIVTDYRSFAREVINQFDFMTHSGVNVTFHDDDPTPMIEGPNGPYPSIKKLFQEYASTGELRIFRSQDGFHCLLDQHTIRHNGREENANSIFRAVHDFFGHFCSGGYFNWSGETAAYYSHAEMFTDDARYALFCETVAQQCGYAVTGSYVDQKCVYIPNYLHNPPLK